MDTLLQEIRNLPNDRAMEAARLLAAEDVAPSKTDSLIKRVAAQSEGLSDQILQQALKNASPDEVAALSRALLAYAVVTGREQDVRLAIEGAGKRLIALEAIAVGALVLAAYQLWVNKGIKKVTHSTRITAESDGKLIITTDVVQENYSVGEILGSAVKAALGLS